MRILIEHAKVVDGTGNPSYTGDVAVEHGMIIDASSYQKEDYDRVIDAGGLCLTPGFIDTHSHSDVQILLDPYVRPKIRQGITTELLGQDGISTAPLPKEHIQVWRKNLAGLDGDSDELTWDWRDTEGYLKELEKKGSATNVMYLVPHGNVRMEAIGLADREPTEEELETMCRILDRELRAGAVGFSSGLIYIPCAYSQKKELIELCKVAASYKRPFVVHQRSEADVILESMEEIIDIGRQSGVHIHFSHFKVCGMRNLHFRNQMAELLEKAEQEGIEVSFDQYPYTAGSTTMTALLPPWAQAGGADDLVARLKDEKERKIIAEDIKNGLPQWDDFIDFAGPEHIRITSVHTDKNQEVIGKTLKEIAGMRNTTIYDVVFDLLIEENLGVSICTDFGTDEDIKYFMKRPEQNVCTDGLFGAKPHPRVYGSFARILDRFVREEKVLTLEEAVYKMSGKPASVFGLKDRGVIAEGKRADLLIFDEKEIRDHATYLDPIRYPTGFHYILVNGEFVYEDGEDTKALPGMVIRQ